MEEEKKEKKPLLGNKSIIIIAIAVLLIGAGAVLILTGNSKNLISTDKDKTENKTQDETSKPEDEPKRAIQKDLTDDAAFDILEKEKEEKLSDEVWSIGAVEVLAHSNNNYLVQYEQVETEGFSKQLLTIITIEDGNGIVKQLPGWVEGEVDITSYNFEYYETSTEQTNPVTEPDGSTMELPEEVDNEPEEPVENPGEQVEQPTEVEPTETEPTEAEPTDVEPVVPAENE